MYGIALSRILGEVAQGLSKSQTSSSAKAEKKLNAQIRKVMYAVIMQVSVYSALRHTADKVQRQCVEQAAWTHQ